MKKNTAPARLWLSRATHSAWFFPVLLVTLLLLLTIFRVSGTSVSQYHNLLFGDTSKDSSLIVGEPRKIRSDEWGVNTPLTLSQAKEGFPVINKTTGQGQDMAITFDVPYKEWSTLFKPQNWSSMIMPVEYAFAFKWWLVGVLLMLGCYALAVAILPGKYLIASLLSVSVFFSPFVQWWYQAGSLLSIALALFIVTLVIRILKPSTNKRMLALQLCGLTYALTCFAFIAYIPFLVPLAMASGAFLLGHVLNTLNQTGNRKQYFQKLSLLALPILVSGCLFIGLLYAHSPVLSALGNSVYPGDRTEPSGGYSTLQLLGGYYNLQLQSDTKASHYDLNQSEASNFILIFPFFIPLFTYLYLKRQRLKVPIDWRVVLLIGVVLLFAIRLFVPASEILFNLLQLNRIPHNRLLIGVGLINVLLIIIAMEQLSKAKPVTAKLRRISTILTFLTVTTVGVGYKLSFQGYLESNFKIVLISSLISLLVWLLLTKRFVAAMGILACYSFLSAGQVNPLYRGLGILTHSKLTSALSSIGDHQSKWVVGDYAASFESLPSATGNKTISGVYAYPQLDMWKGIGSDKAAQDVYNRYAHVFFSVEPLTMPAQGQGAYFDPPALDAFRVHADPCSEFLQKQHVRYILQTSELTSSCTRLIKTISYPQITFRVYEIVR